MSFFSKLEIPRTYYLINNFNKLLWLRDELLKSSEFAFDIENNYPTKKSDDLVKEYLKYNKIRVVGISFSWGRKAVTKPWQPNLSAYVPLVDVRDRDYWGVDQEKVNKVIEELLITDIPKSAHNGKFDCLELYKDLGIKTRAFTFDTMLAKALLDEDSIYCSHALKSDFGSRGQITKLGISDYYLDMGKSEWRKDLKDSLNHYDPVFKRYSKVPLDILYPYACADTDLTLSLKLVLEPLLAEQELTWVFNNITMNLSHSLMIQELNGMPILLERLYKWSEQKKNEMAYYEAQIKEKAGEDFLVSSDQQVAKIIYDKLKLGKPEYTEKGEIKVDAPTLSKLDHPIVKDIIAYRKAEKLNSTYLEGNIRHIKEISEDNKFGWVHSSYFIPSKTSRLRSNSPNITNVIKRDLEYEEETGEFSEGYYARGIYHAYPGYKFLLTDYSNFELRLAAEISQEPAWIQNYLDGKDLHSATAKVVFNLPCTVDEVKDQYPMMRKKAKMVNFAILYGTSEFGLAHNLGIPVEEAQQLIEDYFKALPFLKRCIDNAHEFVKQNGYLTNKFGRRRHLPDAQLKVPRGIYYRYDEVPSCYRKTASPEELELELDDIFQVSKSEITNSIYRLNKKKYFKCRNCPNVRDCFINGELSKRRSKVSRSLRQAFNYLVQSLASDCAHIAHIAVNRRLMEEKLEAKLCGYVHDELIIHAPEHEIEKCKEILEECMVGIITKLLNSRVPIEIDHSVRQTWSNA